ncbi:MAG: tetratricopeptide repeat protein, partial [Alphaproteobacteria bacterium]|nr:tetratricopeptide repeat protein [Alphaproteobacteria bacterium]
MSSILQQAIDFHNSGHLAAAIALYRSVLRDEPDNPDALALLGTLLVSKKDFKEGLSLLKAAEQLDPKTPLFKMHLGNAYCELEDYKNAGHYFSAAAEVEPNLFDAHFKLAQVLIKLDNFKAAEEALEKAVRLQPQDATSRVQLSEMYYRNNNIEKARDEAVKAIELAPDNLGAFIALALALNRLDQEESALEALECAIKIKPDFAPVWNMLSCVYQKIGMLDEAEAISHKAIELAGAKIENEDTRFVEEEEYSTYHWDLAILELLKGDYERGFAHYRARFKRPEKHKRFEFPSAVWKGESIQGKKILAVGEQGYGDVIMMSRFLPLLKSYGAEVALLARHPLKELMESAGLADYVITKPPKEQNEFDVQTSLFDLPYYLEMTPERISGKPYIPVPAIDDKDLLELRRYLKGQGDNNPVAVGVVWAGNSLYENSAYRDIALSSIERLFKSYYTGNEQESQVEFYNFTRDISAEDIERIEKYRVKDLSKKLNNFSDTAKYIAQMDLIISCDTSVAHLAGAMGKPVWTLIPFSPDWRWLMD